ncbi:hypothetical protein G6F68_013021 [Rhizopus microsporus]|nr:hypothetical protein G6F68_013021 [Rhizopus microsporus]
MALVGLEAEFERHAAKEQAQQHEDQRQVQRAEDDGVRKRKRRHQARAAQHQPGLVAVPDGRHGVDHDVAFITVADQRKEDADSQVEAIHHHIHHHAEQDDDGPYQCKIDAHGLRLLNACVARARCPPGWTRRTAGATAGAVRPGRQTAGRGPARGWGPCGSGAACTTRRRRTPAGRRPRTGQASASVHPTRGAWQHPPCASRHRRSRAGGRTP